MRLLAWRAMEGVSREALSQATGLAYSSIFRIERGTHWPEADSILRIWKASDGKVTAQDHFDAYVEAMVNKRGTNGEEA